MLTVCSLNIRRRKLKDFFHHWFFRKNKLIKTIVKYNPDVLCLQEVDEVQLEYILKHLKEKYICYCPEDNSDGLYQPIFIKQGINLKDANVCWLNQNKNKGEKSWDEKYPRFTSYINILYNNENYIISNIHFDHKGLIAREHQAKIIYQEIKNYCYSNKLKSSKLIFIGDFNETFNETAFKYFSRSCSEVNSNQSTYYPGFNISAGYVKDFIFTKNINICEKFVDEQKGKFPYSDHTLIGVKIDTYN